MRIGFANGCFDQLHTGHRFFLREARKHCDWLIVAINTDESIRRLKGDGRPLKPLRERVLDLYMSGYANSIIPFTGDPRPLLLEIPVNVLIRGEDQSEEGRSNLHEFVRIPRLQGYSTTQILQALTREEYENAPP